MLYSLFSVLIYLLIRVIYTQIAHIHSPIRNRNLQQSNWMTSLQLCTWISWHMLGPEGASWHSFAASAVGLLAGLHKAMSSCRTSHRHSGGAQPGGLGQLTQKCRGPAAVMRTPRHVDRCHHGQWHWLKRRPSCQGGEVGTFCESGVGTWTQFFFCEAD